jgi:hypothetical protein
VSKLSKCQSRIEKDPIKFGIECTTENLVKWIKVELGHSTDVARLKAEAKARALAKAHGRSSSSSSFNDFQHADALVITNATILTMHHGSVKEDLVREGTVVIKGGVIVEVVDGAASDVWERVKEYVERGADVLDADGGKLAIFIHHFSPSFFYLS